MFADWNTSFYSIKILRRTAVWVLFLPSYKEWLSQKFNLCSITKSGLQLRTCCRNGEFRTDATWLGNCRKEQIKIRFRKLKKYRYYCMFNSGELSVAGRAVAKQSFPGHYLSCDVMGAFFPCRLSRTGFAEMVTQVTLQVTACSFWGIFIYLRRIRFNWISIRHLQYWLQVQSHQTFSEKLSCIRNKPGLATFSLQQACCTNVPRSRQLYNEFFMECPVLTFTWGYFCNGATKLRGKLHEK